MFVIGTFLPSLLCHVIFVTWLPFRIQGYNQCTTYGERKLFSFYQKLRKLFVPPLFFFFVILLNY